MTLADVVDGLVLVAVVWFLMTLPLFKPWFGLRKPKNHPGRWWT